MGPRGRLVWGVTGVLVLVLSPLLLMLSRVGGFGLRDNADLFALTLSSPLSLAFPIAIGLLAAGPLAISIETRWVSNTRSRTDARVYVLSRLTGAGVLGIAVGTLTVLVPGVVCFVLWPVFGNPSIDPAGYFLTAEQAQLDSFSRFTYSEWLEDGYWAFLFRYGAVVAVSGASFAILSVVGTLAVANAYLGAALPGAVAVLSTVGAALLGVPQSGIVYSIFPFGLQAIEWQVGSLPIAALIFCTVALSTFVLLRARRLSSLR